MFRPVLIFSRANLGTLSTNLTIQACGAATGILTARMLGPIARGELATVLLWPTILSNLGLMGCQWVLAREVASNPRHEDDWTMSGVCVGMASALVFFLAGFFLVPLLIPSDKTYLLPIVRLCLWLIPFDICNQVLLGVEQGRMRWRRYNLLRLSFFLVYLLLITLIWLIKKGQLIWFVWAFLASQALTVLVRLWVRRHALASGRFQFEQSRRLLCGGVPYFGATISSLVTLQLDTVLVVSLLSTKAAGIYAVAGTFAGGQASLGDALGITSFAIASNDVDPARRRNFIPETFRLSALLSLGVGMTLACLIPFLVKPLFGASFQSAIWPAVILAVAASWTGSANILDQGLRGAGRPQAGLVSQVAGSAFLALSVLFLLRRFGIMGVSCAVMMGASVQVSVLIYAAARWLGISPIRFWPFGESNFRLFWQQLTVACLRFSRSIA